jgi:flagellar hook-associated protein 2
MSGNLSSLRSSLAALDVSSAYGNLKAASSDTAILNASVSASASRGTFAINVVSLARPQVTVSAERQFSDIAAPVIDGGTFSITQNGVSTNIDLTGVQSLTQLRDAINAQQAGVKASIINDGSSADTPARPFRLILASASAGINNAFSVNDQTTLGGGAPGAALNLSTDPANGVALNSVLTYNGISIQSPSTTVTDAIPGLTLVLQKIGASTVTVTDDDSSLKEKIKSFVTAFNGFNDFVQGQFKIPVDGAGRAALATDPLLRSVNRQIRTYLSSDHTNAGTIQNLTELGVRLNQNGKLEIDDATLDSALSNSRDDVETLFSGPSGFAAKVTTVLDSYTAAGGAIDVVENRIQKTIDSYNQKILTLETQLALREDVLTNQFAAADRAISQLNSQLNALNGLGSQFRLF